MKICVNDWVFNVDVPLNMEISSAQAKEHCTCGYCRNYYAAIDKACPTLRPFLANFGIDIEGPDELSPFEPTIYEASYIINGTIAQPSESGFFIDWIPVKVLSSQRADMDTERPDPYFVFVVGLIELPWVLQEDPADVISPANEAAYLQRMQNKLLTRMCDADITS